MLSVTVTLCEPAPTFVNPEVVDPFDHRNEKGDVPFVMLDEIVPLAMPQLAGIGVSATLMESDVETLVDAVTVQP